MKKDVLRGIRYFCLECCGYGKFNQVKDCNAPSCPLYAFRFGKDPSPRSNMHAYKLSPQQWAKMRAKQTREEWIST